MANDGICKGHLAQVLHLVLSGSCSFRGQSPFTGHTKGNSGAAISYWVAKATLEPNVH